MRFRILSTLVLVKCTNKEKIELTQRELVNKQKRISSQNLMLRCEVRGNERLANQYVESALDLQGLTRHTKFAVIK